MALSYHEALQAIQTNANYLKNYESLPLFDALNRICAHAITASFELPKSAISLRDGYAIRLDKRNLIPYKECIMVSTGDALSSNIDAVIALEEAVIEDDYLHIPLHVKSGWQVKKQGEDIAHDEHLVTPYERLNAYKMTALAAQGIMEVSVLCKPKVAILSIGNALTSLGEPLAKDSFYNSNAISLSARCIELGADVVAIETASEERSIIMDALTRLQKQADVIITTGGLSKGDIIAQLLLEKKLNIIFHEVAITPAKPTSLSSLDQTLILHLPGLPLGSMLGFELLGAPLLKALQHELSIMPRSYIQTNGAPFTCRDNSVSAVPGFSDGKIFVCAPHYEAGRLNILSQCNGYVRVENCVDVKRGDAVEFIPFYM